MWKYESIGWEICAPLCVKAIVKPCWANDALQHSTRWTRIHTPTHINHHSPDFPIFSLSSSFVNHRFFQTLPSTCVSYHPITMLCFILIATSRGFDQTYVFCSILTDNVSPLPHFKREPSFIRTDHFSKRLNITAHFQIYSKPKLCHANHTSLKHWPQVLVRDFLRGHCSACEACLIFFSKGPKSHLIFWEWHSGPYVFAAVSEDGVTWWPDWRNVGYASALSCCCWCWWWQWRWQWRWWSNEIGW